METVNDSIRVSFIRAKAGLGANPLSAEYVPSSEQPDKKVPLARNVPDSPLEGFAIGGEDQAWEWADAKIEGDAIMVRAMGVPKPVAVRDGWPMIPFATSTTRPDFRASPFRSDSFPAITRQVKF